MNLDDVLILLADDPSAPVDLAEAALLLARDEYPGLDVEAYLGELAALAREVRPRLVGGLEARTRALCRYLFHDLGFRGNARDYYDPRNSYLNEVLDRRTGLPIALAATAMAVGGRAGLTVVGVGLPGHFVAKATDGDEEVLFDPFHGGRLLTPADCEGLAARTAGVPFAATPEALAAVPTGLIVLRMLNNLKVVYLARSDFIRAARVIERLRQLRPDDLEQGRDLGAALLQAGQAGKALRHLEAYLRAVPDATDRDEVERLLTTARSAVSRWN
jgi:regulator of sirC expression with transglutaminase-like and TPR domain